LGAQKFEEVTNWGAEKKGGVNVTMGGSRCGIERKRKGKGERQGPPQLHDRGVAGIRELPWKKGKKLGRGEGRIYKWPAPPPPRLGDGNKETCDFRKRGEKSKVKKGETV